MNSKILTRWPYFKKSYLLILFFTLSFSSFSQWNWLNPLPQGNTLRDVQFINSTIGYTVGDGGTILKTTDSGITWERLNSGTICNLSAVFFINADVGYVCGGNMVLKTTDGGSSWIIASQAFWPYLYDIWFTGESTGYVCGNFDNIFKTTDGGFTWVFIGSIPGDDFLSIYFTDSLTGYVGGGDGIYKTTNAGNTWTTCYSGTSGYYLNPHFFFTSADTGYAVCYYGKILRTTNAGQTWEIQIVDSSIVFSGIFFNTSSTGFAVGGTFTDAAVLYKTNDSGITWSLQPSPFPDWVCSVSFSEPSTGMIVGSYGSMARTIDSGFSWNALSSYFTVNGIGSIFFTGSNTGYCSTSGGEIFKTTDGGNSWALSFSGVGTGLGSLIFTDDTTGYVCGTGTILKTTNAGNSWNLVFSSGPEYFNSLCFPTHDTGYILGNYKILKTTNAGSTWNQISMLDPPHPNSMFFTSRDTGYLCRNWGVLNKTIDGGISFYQLNPGISDDILNVSFRDKNTGFISTNTGKLLRSIDEGNSWIEIYNGPFVARSWSFPDSLHGYCVGGGGYLRTLNGGESWILFPPTLTAYDYSDGFFTSVDTGYIVGNYGMMLKTTNGSVITGNDSRIIKHKIKLFPNPCNGEFVIEFPMKSEQVTVQVFDLSGKKIYTNSSSGQSGKIKYTLKRVTPGLYIVKVILTTEIWTGKLIVN